MLDRPLGAWDGSNAGAARIHLDLAPDLGAVATEWQALEAQAEASFFQSWTWVGCQAEVRFPKKLLLRVEQDGQIVGLALLNRANNALWLGESGDAALDAVYVEHNGPLLARGCEHLLAACLARLLAAGRLRLSGVGDVLLAAARTAGTVRWRRSSPAPFVDLSKLAEADYLAGLSSNTRYQIRRSDRAYAAAGPISVQRAVTLAEAEEFLEALAMLHQASWAARGRPGAFANPAFLRFHQALLARAMPRGEVELLRIAAGAQVVGYLYNFRHRDRVFSYQSGFDYAAAGPHAKPGLTCHHAAIGLARREGATRYDFLAGGDRYKTSFAKAATPLYWLDVARPWSLRGVAHRLRDALAG